MSDAHLVVEGLAAHHRLVRRGGAAGPVLAVVLLEQAARTERVRVHALHGVLDLARCGRVHQAVGPHLGLVRAARVILPDRVAAGNPAEVREHVAGDELDAILVRAEHLDPARRGLLEILVQDPRLLLGAHPTVAGRVPVRAERVPGFGGYLQAVVVLVELVRVLVEARRGAVRERHVIPVAGVVVAGELPVRPHDPLVDAGDEFRAAVAFQNEVHVPGHVAEVVQEARRVRGEGGEDETLVGVHLRGLDEAVLRQVDLVVVPLLAPGDPDEFAVRVVGPGVVRTGEPLGVAPVGAADPHAPVPATVDQGVQRAVQAAGDDDGLLAHIGGEEIAGLRNLALVAEEHPGALEDALLLRGVDLGIPERLPADPGVVVGYELRAIHCHLPPLPTME